ncbi:MAG TPA: rhodanese-like domain-containing protein [Steroidobacteraceae bacterium]|jgi:rhodanese-related sulfurtransferase|nr:rhodanese-like domain-containing protein [Steroidobacteraceae bacterium]
MDRLLEYCSHHPWLASLALIAAIAVLVNELRLRALSVAALAPQDVIRLMNQGATVLDLRAEQDYQAGHINGARHFDSGQLANAAEALKRYKERALIVYCDRGSSAPAAVKMLSSQGFTKVFNLRGGLAAWRAENLPLARD